jgi:CPA1 family monovalent cation:H+ antiporter
MNDIAKIVHAVAALLVIVGLAQPLAARLRLPPTVLLAAIGTGLGGLAVFVLTSGHLHQLDGVARTVTTLPISSSAILFIFLPLLLFQAAMMMDARRLLDDAVPILLLAVIAVFVTTAAVGFALEGASGMPLAACLLVGAIVATTDPSAVVAIFRSLGTPTRLTRLVEGESLLNDAAAIALSTILIDMIRGGGAPDFGQGFSHFIGGFAGGMLFGIIAARLILAVMPLLKGDRAAETTLLLALPYLVFVASELTLHVSGVVAVVASGLTVGTVGRIHISPDNRGFIIDIWEQMAFWAGSLVFILASLFVPRLLVGLGTSDLLLLLTVIGAAGASRVLVLFGLLPPLAFFRLSPKIGTAYKLVIAWGGLRGAVTLALALAVSEDPSLPDGVKRFVTIMATGFVLFTLFVNGTTLRPLIRLFRLDQLSARDQALRNQIVALSMAQARDAIAEAAAEYKVPQAAAALALETYNRRIELATERSKATEPILERDRLGIGLLALASYERRLVLEHYGQQAISRQVVEFLLRHADNLLEGARGGGRVGYVRAAKRTVGYSPGFKISHFLHRRFHLDQPLQTRLANRFEALLVLRIVLEELMRFNRRRMPSLLGERMTEVMQEVLLARFDRVMKFLDALKLQYPDFFEALEYRFLRLSGLRLEHVEYRALYEDGLIGQELYDNLNRAVETARSRTNIQPQLDLKLEPHELVKKIDMFSDLTPDQVDRLCRVIRPRIVVPEEVIYRRGQRGDSVFFISSGAIEIRLTGGSTLALGPGAIVGQTALLTGEPRTADVVALTYSRILVLYAGEFRRFLAANPDVRAEIERITQEQLDMNRRLVSAQRRDDDAAE